MFYRLISLASLALLAGCAQLSPAPAPAVAAAAAKPAAPTAAAADTRIFAPNPNLHIEGIPPVPQSLVERVAAYTQFRGHGFVDWHPQQRQMLVSHRRADENTPQVYLLRQPMGELEPITREAEPVWQASFEPRQGRYIVFGKSIGGNEATQYHTLDLATRAVIRFTNPEERHSLVGWLKTRSELIHSSVPLDRTAAAGSREQVATTFWQLDPLQPQARRKLAELAGPGWFGGDISRDDRFMAITRYLSAAESEVWLMDLSTGQHRKLLPAANEVVKATHYAGSFTPDGRHLSIVTSRFGEFIEVALLELATGQLRRINTGVNWDMAGGATTRDGRFNIVQFNINGRDEMRLFGALPEFKPLPLPALPPGSVGSTSFHDERPELAFSMNSAQGPSQLYTLDVASGKLEQWTKAYGPPSLDASRFGDQQVVTWPSFDGRTISGLLNRPPARFTGKRPVLIDVHGGPEAQAQLGFMGRYNYFINEMGIAVIQPNVRGSTGFGKSFVELDNGFKREDAVKDIGALLDWIARQPDLDASRVVVGGVSYGGYMAAAVSVHYADRIAGAIKEVGISNFLSFLANTESYRRDLRRVEYGDERDPAMRAFLERISPLNNAQRISKPMLVIHGKNDPRVPVSEAEQIVAQLRKQGTPVWYLRADNEGHGFVRRENADYRFYAMVQFLQARLLN
jgi:dipeptidyl aminopeptidase/acylaminoacyl peptidase